MGRLEFLTIGRSATRKINFLATRKGSAKRNLWCSVTGLRLDHRRPSREDHHCSNSPYKGHRRPTRNGTILKLTAVQFVFLVGAPPTSNRRAGIVLSAKRRLRLLACNLFLNRAVPRVFSLMFSAKMLIIYKRLTFRPGGLHQSQVVCSFDNGLFMNGFNLANVPTVMLVSCLSTGIHVGSFQQSRS